MVNRLRFTPVFCAALGAAAGFYLLVSPNSLFSVVNIVVLFVSLAALCFFRVLASLNKEDRFLQLTAVCSAALSAGIMLGLCAADAGRVDVKFAFPQGSITAVEGVLLEDPRIISGGRAFVSVSLKRCAAGSMRGSAGGDLVIFFPQGNAETLRQFGRGTSIFAEGNLRSSETGWTFSAVSMHILKPASSVERMRTGIRLNLISRFDGKDWGGLALALVLGIRDNLDINLTAMYREAGLSYILALSGMHLAVITALIAFFLKKPLGLKAAAVAGAVIICLYIFIVGPLPSLNRAALMYLLGVCAVLGALPKEPVSILSLSFLIQIVITPAAGNTISFILSYLAMIGIFLLGNPIYSLAAGKAPDFLLRPLSVSCGAFISTAGITSVVFKIIVPMGIITGLLIVPLTTLFMTGSLIWLILDTFSLSPLLDIPLSLVYRLMEAIVSLAGKIGVISPVSPYSILAISFVLSALIIFLEFKLTKARLKLQPFD